MTIIFKLKFLLSLKMNVSTLWLIYILIILISYSLLNYYVTDMNFNIKIFLTLILGGLFVFLSTYSVDISNERDQFWLSILHLLAYLLPLISGIYIFYKDGYFESLQNSLLNVSKKCVTETEYIVKNGQNVISKIKEICPKN